MGGCLLRLLAAFDTQLFQIRRRARVGSPQFSHGTSDLVQGSKQGITSVAVRGPQRSFHNPSYLTGSWKTS